MRDLIYTIFVEGRKEQPKGPSNSPGVVAAFALVALSGGLMLVRLGHPTLLEPDEPRYAAPAMHMLRHGDWLMPQFNGEPRVVKAPLFYWTVALSQGAFGKSEWAVRLPSALCAVALVLLTWRLGASIFGNAAGFIAGVVLATSPITVALARLAIPDMFQAVLLTVALALFWRVARGAGGVGCILGFLFVLGAVAWVKNGLVSLIVLASCAVYCLWAKDWKPWRLMLTPAGLLGIAVFLALSVSWPLYAAWRVGGAGEVWKNETVLRFTTGGDHPEPPWYYVGVLPVVFMPWTIYTPLAVVRWRVHRGRAGRGAILLVSLLATGFVLLSACRGKLPTYVLPLIVPLAILTGWGLEGTTGRESDSERSHGLLSRSLWGALGTHLVLLVAVLGAGFIRPKLLSQTPQALWALLTVPAVILQGGGLLLGGTARCRAALATVVAALIWMYAVGLIGLVPRLGQRYSSASLVPQVAANLGPGTRLMSYKYLPTALVYYLDRRVEEYRNTRTLRRAMSSAESFLLVVPANHLKSVQEETGFVLKVIAASGSGRKCHVVAVPVGADRLKPGDGPVE